MKNNYLRSVHSFMLFTAAFLLFVFSSTAQNFEKYYQDGLLFVKFHDDFDPQIPVAADHSVRMEDAIYFQDIISAYEIEEITRPMEVNNDIKLLRTFLFSFKNHFDLDAVIPLLESLPEIEYAEKVPMDYIDYIPNDSLYNLINGPLKWKWHLDVINAEQAWDITKGSPDIKVAIVDNAVWAQHPDLEAKIVAQRDVIHNTNNSNPPGFGNAGDWSHGTHVAGLATAITDNEIGVAGIGFNTSIIAVKAANNSNAIGVFGYQGVLWAVNNGAHIINMSFGGPSYSQTMQNLIISGNNMGINFIGSAGNDNTSQTHYPSGYQHVISVAATNDNDEKSWFSNYGTAVDVSAPGGSASPGPNGLLSTTYDNTSMGFYDYYFGTSMSSPVVTGLVSLMRSINPSITPADLEAVLKATCDNIDAMNPNFIGQLGAGRINAYEAVKAVPFSPVASFSTPVTTILPGQTINFTDHSTGIPASWSWFFDGASPSTSTSQHPQGIKYDWPGSYKVVLTVQNAYGNNALTIEQYIHVTATPTPYLQFEVNETETCIYSTVVFDDQSLYEPTSWLWDFEPDTYEFVNGTDANSQNPEVIFTAPGTYHVIMSAENSNGISNTIFEDFIFVKGLSVPEAIDFESGSADPFEIETNVKSFIRVNRRASHESNYGLHFTGGATPTGWAGTPAGTTPAQAWNQNTDFQASAYICNVDATEFAGVHLFFDLRQTFSLGVKTSWFRVLVNDTIQVADSEGNTDFNPTSNQDPFVRKHFDLSDFGGTVFKLTLQSCCRLYDYFIEQGDNVFVDNLEILGSLVGESNLAPLPVQKLFVRPNPARDRIFVEIQNSRPRYVELTMHSLTGQKVYGEHRFLEEGNHQTTINISGIVPGMYLLVVKDADNVEVQKVLIY